MGIQLSTGFTLHQQQLYSGNNATVLLDLLIQGPNYKQVQAGSHATQGNNNNYYRVHSRQVGENSKFANDIGAQGGVCKAKVRPTCLRVANSVHVGVQLASFEALGGRDFGVIRGGHGCGR